MLYTKEDGGRLNSFAVEPKVVRTEPMTPAKMRNYVIVGVGGSILVGALTAMAFYVSNVA